MQDKSTPRKSPGLQASFLSLVEKTCTRCQSAKPLRAFWKSRYTRDGYHNHCKVCVAAERLRVKLAHPERYHSSKLKNKYGITHDEYMALLAAQNGGCAICGSTKGAKDFRMDVDHDHDSGKVRGILCHNCNCALGYARDDPAVLEAAILYLRRTNGP